MLFCARFVLIAFVLLVAAILAIWGTLAIWFQMPGSDIARYVATGSFAVLGIATVVAQFTQARLRFLTVFTPAFLGIALWWSTILPPSDGNWAADVAHQVTGTIDGDRLTLTGVRNFTWTGPKQAVEAWETRNYDLSSIDTMDLFMSYWAGPEMAHMIISFGFATGEYLAWSVEVRREIGSGFSPVADFFKTHTLTIVAADERDVVGVRSNIRNEDVQVFRLNTPPENARALLEQYVRDANALAEQPEFYNSLFTNCTTVVFTMIRTVVGKVPLDWRMIANGYMPDYAYDEGILDRQLPLSALREKGAIRVRALAVGLGSTFPSAIRVGVPSPLD